MPSKNETESKWLKLLTNTSRTVKEELKLWTLTISARKFNRQIKVSTHL